jgi:ABC-type nitrate/sulfonate/bicarbonate transport system permease component
MSTEQQLPGSAPVVAPVPKAPGPRKDAAGRRHRSLGVAIVLDLVVVAIGLVAWQYAVDSGPAGGLLYGSPVAIGHALASGLHSGELITILGATPIAALAPIIIVWVGTGITSKVVMSASSVVITALVLAFDGARGTDPLQIRLLRSLGSPTSRIFRLLVLPSSLVQICGGLRLTAGLALVGAIIGEFVSSSAGLGHAILTAGSLYDVSTVLANLLIVGLMSLLLLGAIRRVERRVLRWRFLALSA